MSRKPGSTAWFAAHEARLQWREFTAMMTGGRPARAITLLIVMLVFGAFLHWLAYVVIAPQVAAGIEADKATLVALSGGGVLFWSVMLSQAIESVTRAYYARADLDLILSSPASSRRLFAVRTGAIALASMMLACLLASPAINVLAVIDGPRWLMAYGVLAVLGALAAAAGVLVTLGLFRLVGARRARLIAQIIAAIVGAGFVIGIQAVAILQLGTYSRVSFFQSPAVVAAMPDAASPLWLPARAAMGDGMALAAFAVVGFGALLAVIWLSASSYGRHAIAAAGVAQMRSRQGVARAFRLRSVKQTLRAKEWKLLRRDPWLLSQTLMQMLYLLPPALLLWINYGDASGVSVVIVPVLVMAGGQLAGGLAWLAISGEDAHDLVATAPVSPRTVLTAKIEAVMGAVGVLLAPLALAFAIVSPGGALVAAAGIALAAASSTAIQMWFRTQARRSQFRRRQTSSRVATLAEAFSSILWAATAASVAAGGIVAILGVLPAVLALIVLLIAWLISPRPRRAKREKPPKTQAPSLPAATRGIP